MISITLPSLYPDSCARTLRNICDATRSPYEVILVSPFPPPDDLKENVTWIEEPAGTGTGCNAGHAAGFATARGEYLMPWVDDHFFLDGWDTIAIPTWQARSKAYDGKPFLLGLRHIFPHHVGTEFGIYYPYFPFAARAVFEMVGWFDPAYRAGFADSDLALRVWDAGGRCEWSDRALVHVHLEDDNRKGGVVFAGEDMTIFLSRWAEKYGQGWRTDHIRDFNIDIEPGAFPDLCVGNTVHYNTPMFRDVVLDGGWRP